MIPKNYDRTFTKGQLWEWIFRTDDNKPDYSEFYRFEFTHKHLYRALEYCLGEHLTARMTVNISPLTYESLNAVLRNYYWDNTKPDIDLPASLAMIVIGAQVETQITNPNDILGTWEQILRDYQIPEDFKQRLRIYYQQDPEYWKPLKPIRLLETAT